MKNLLVSMRFHNPFIFWNRRFLHWKSFHLIKIVVIIESTNKSYVTIQAFKQYFSIYLLARLESAYSLICGSLKIWGKGGGDTLALL